MYILPSSIHEVIAVPAEGLEPDEMRNTVSFVNFNGVEADEILSDSIYKYCIGSGRLEIV